MNYDAVMRSLTDDELAGLLRFFRAVVAQGQGPTRHDDPVAYDAYATWHGLGGWAAAEQQRLGLDSTPPRTLDDVLDYFTDPELACVRIALEALRDKRPIPPAAEFQYGRYLLIGGPLTSVPYHEDEEAAIKARTLQQLAGSALASLPSTRPPHAQPPAALPPRTTTLSA